MHTKTFLQDQKWNSLNQKYRSVKRTNWPTRLSSYFIPAVWRETTSKQKLLNDWNVGLIVATITIHKNMAGISRTRSVKLFQLTVTSGHFFHSVIFWLSNWLKRIVFITKNNCLLFQNFERHPFCLALF